MQLREAELLLEAMQVGTGADFRWEIDRKYM